MAEKVEVVAGAEGSIRRGRECRQLAIPGYNYLGK
jgi:hypothetical protein